jgi:hypothetical protein
MRKGALPPSTSSSAIDAESLPHVIRRILPAVKDPVNPIQREIFVMTRSWRAGLIMLLTLTVAASGAAANERFTATDIKEEIIGKRIYLAVPLGGEFPLNYRANGQVDGSGEALGLGRFAKPNDKGRWWINGDRLCQQFTSWYKGAPMCFELIRIGDKRLKWIRDNGQTGTARIGNSI